VQRKSASDRLVQNKQPLDLLKCKACNVYTFQQMITEQSNIVAQVHHNLDSQKVDAK